MFYGNDYSAWFRLVYWTVVTVVFGVSLHLALRATKIELESKQELYVIVISSLVVLTPAVGPYLAFIPAVILTYRMADTRLSNVFGAMTLTWLITFIGLLLVFGLYRCLMAVGVFST
jgi:hypothetical protein